MPKDEAPVVVAVVHDLKRQFPQVRVEDVQLLVEREWLNYQWAPVRDFVPVLVYKTARAQLLNSHLT